MSTIRFLIVDDTSFMRKMASDYLKQFGYEVAGEAVNGKEAIRKYKELRPDVVLMDLTMPEMDGTEALKRILQINPQAVVLICSASNQQEQILKALEAGAKGYLLKPFNPDRLQEIIRENALPFLLPSAANETVTAQEAATVQEAAAGKDPVQAGHSAEAAAQQADAHPAEVQQAVPQQAEVPQAGVQQAEVPQAGVQQAEVPQANLQQAGTQQADAHPADIQKAEAQQTEPAQIPHAITHPCATDPIRGNPKMKSFVSSLVCNWEEENGENTFRYSVICTESENKLVIEVKNDQEEKQMIPFSIDGFRHLAGWLENHLSTAR